MLRVRNVRLEDCDQPSVDIEDFSTELHECDFDKISSLLTVLANELAADHYRFNVARSGLVTTTEHE